MLSYQTNTIKVTIDNVGGIKLPKEVMFASGMDIGDTIEVFVAESGRVIMYNPNRTKENSNGKSKRNKSSY